MFLAEGKEQGLGHWGGEVDILGLVILASSLLIIKEIAKLPVKIPPPRGEEF